MKKLTLIILFFAISAVVVVMARTFHVEKASNVTLKKQGTEVKAGANLDENTEIKIPKGGVLVIVDKSAGKRWAVKKKFSGKVSKLAKENKKNLETSTKAVFYNNVSKKKEKKQKQSGVTLLGGNKGADLIPRADINEWDFDTTYQFLDTIPGDIIEYYLIE